jgi:hypothetical protein
MRADRHFRCVVSSGTGRKSIKPVQVYEQAENITCGYICNNYKVGNRNATPCAHPAAVLRVSRTGLRGRWRRARPPRDGRALFRHGSPGAAKKTTGGAGGGGGVMKREFLREQAYALHVS